MQHGLGNPELRAMLGLMSHPAEMLEHMRPELFLDPVIRHTVEATCDWYAEEDGSSARLAELLQCNAPEGYDVPRMMRELALGQDLSLAGARIALRDLEAREVAGRAGKLARDLSACLESAFPDLDRAADLRSKLATLELRTPSTSQDDPNPQRCSLAELLVKDPAEEPENKFHTGLPWFDQCMPDGALTRGDKVLIGGEPGVGKTAFALNVVSRALSDNPDATILWAAGEMSPKALRNRILTLSSGLPKVILKKRYEDLTPDQAHAKRTAIDTLRAIGTRLHILRAPITPSAIRASCDELEPAMMVVDYLQLMTPDEAVDTRREGVDECLRSIVDLSQSREIISMILSSAAKPTHGGKLDAWSAFKESSELRYAADLAYIGERTSEPDGNSAVEITWKCIKARDGEQKDIKTLFQGALCRFQRGF